VYLKNTSEFWASAVFRQFHESRVIWQVYVVYYSVLQVRTCNMSAADSEQNLTCLLLLLRVSSQSKPPIRVSSEYISVCILNTFSTISGTSLTIIVVYKNYASTVRFLARARNFSLLQNLQTGSGNRPASNSMGTVGARPVEEAAGVWSWQLPYV
jgi:hypothetical protein